MAFLSTALPVIQVALSVILVAGILLQQRGAGLGGAFGAEQSETFYTRRGAEKLIFQATIAVAIMFTLSILLAFVI